MNTLSKKALIIIKKKLNLSIDEVREINRLNAERFDVESRYIQ